MPLRDHFRPPLANRRPWDVFHGQWPAMIVAGLNRILPERYVAGPRVHLGSAIEIDVATHDEDEAELPPAGKCGQRRRGGDRGLGAAPPDASRRDRPAGPGRRTRCASTTTRSGRRLVAAVEIVSPANKDRPEHRRAFVAKCVALLQDHVCVAIVDLVTTRTSNLYRDLMEFLGQTETHPSDGPPPLYAVVLRWANKADAWLLETWMNPLTLGRPLPTLPLWLAQDLAVPLELEASYEETCRILRFPPA